MKIINASDLKPVSATYSGDDNISFNDSAISINTNDGYPYIISSTLNSLVDFKSNKYSIFGLTSQMDTIDLISDDVIDITTKGLLVFTSLSDSANVIGIDPFYNIVLVDIADDTALVLAFEHIQTVLGIEYYAIMYRNKALTVDPLSNILHFNDYNKSPNQLFAIEGSYISCAFRLKSMNGEYGIINGDDKFYVSHDNIDYIDLTGKDRQVGYFNGVYGSTTDTVDYGNSLLSSSTEMTIILEAEFISSNSTTYGRFIQKNDFNDGYEVGFSLQRSVLNDTVYIRIDTSGGINQSANIGTVFNTGKTHIIAVIINNGVVDTYLDGVLTTSKSYNQGSGFLDPASTLYLGSGGGALSGLRTEMNLSRFVLYDKALSTSELNDAMNGSNYYNPIQLSTFSDNGDSIIKDQSGHGNHGILTSSDISRFYSHSSVLNNGNTGVAHIDTRGSVVVDGYTSTNTWTRYSNFYAPEYSITPSNLSVDVAGSISGVSTNFILNAPYEDITINDDIATIAFDIIPTKNFKTISSELSLIPASGISGAELVDFRDYHRIYTGGNQVEGYSNINLGYLSDYSSVITFKGDKFTYFHYPKSAVEIPIQSAGFEFAGAFAGIVPEFSDRIYKRLVGYEDMVWWGGGSHDGIQDGTWLCSWLSGDDIGSTWVERYYDPGVITSEHALSAYSGTVVDAVDFIPNSNPVQDVVSTMTLEGGGYYKYFHVGNGGFTSILNALKGITDDNLVIQLSDFTLGDIVDDDSKNNNDGIVSNYDNADVVTLDIGFGSEQQSALLLNGNSEIHINSAPSLNIEQDKSISAWIYSRNWSNGRSSTMFSNYYKGGDKFEYINHGLYYSYIIPSDEFNNESFTIIPSEISSADQLINYDEIDGKPISVAVDLDGFLWIATYIAPSASDNTGKTLLFKLTSSGKVLESVSISLDDFGEIKQVVIADDNIGYLIDIVGNVKQFNLHDISFTAHAGIPAGDYAYINNNGAFTARAGNVVDMDIFNDGIICEIKEGSGTRKLYINNEEQPISTTQTVKRVVCDDDLYYFATTYDTGNMLRLYKFNKDDDSIVDQRAMEGTPDAINVPFISKESINGIVATVIYWVGDTQIHKYFINSDDELERILKLDTNSFTGDINGDFSGYKLNKIITNINNSVPYLKYSAIIGDVNNMKKHSILYSVNVLSDNWHYFTIIKDSSIERITLYVDGDYATHIDNINNGILYLTGSMLNIGGASDGSDPLFPLLGLVDRDLDGGVSEFSIFNVVLDATDVKSLYISKFAGNDEMDWVIDNGQKDFVEELQHIFKFKKPGIKSQFFNVIVKNLNLSDEEKVLYELDMRLSMGDLLPANIKMVNIIWR